MRGSNASLSLLFVAIMLTLFVTAVCGQGNSHELEQESSKLRSLLSPESKKGWHRFVKGTTFDAGRPSKFFNDHRDAFGLQDGSEMVLVRTVEEPQLQMNHYQFQQAYNGIPIIGAQYILHHKRSLDSELKGNGRIVSNFMKKESALISPETAIQKILDMVRATRYGWESSEVEAALKESTNNLSATFYPHPRLVYHSPSGSEDPGAYQLSYELSVFTLEPVVSNKTYYVSASDGKVIDSFDLIHENERSLPESTLPSNVGTSIPICGLLGTSEIQSQSISYPNQSSASLALTWSDAGTGSSYKVEYRIAGSSSYVLAFGPSSLRSFTLTGLIPNNTYDIRITAKRSCTEDGTLTMEQTFQVTQILIPVAPIPTGVTLYNGTQAIATSLVGGTYVLRETNRAGSGTSISTYDMNFGGNYSSAVDFQNNSTTWVNEPVGVQGHWGAEKTIDYYRNVHNRNSFDDRGGEVKVYVDYLDRFNNASWNGSVFTFGSGDGVTKRSWTALDIVGHEITHAVTDYTAGLVYRNESGALNESFSDIFGNLVQFSVTGKDEWLCSEDVTVNGAGIRSMSNPNLFQDADTYLGTYWVLPDGGDNGGVHSNSGVQNFWFYLLSAGASGTNDIGNSFSVSGIGRDKAAKIAYRSLTRYLTPFAGFKDAREAALFAAEDLEGRNSASYAQTAMAWYAVGVGTPIYAGQDLALTSINFTGASCNQISIEIVNRSTTEAIPAGAQLSLTIKENGLLKPIERITLTAPIGPGQAMTKALTSAIASASGKIDLEIQVSYTPDPEPRNNSLKRRIFRNVVTIGGSSPDFQKINDAVIALSAPEVALCGNVTFKIRSGVYNEEIFLSNIGLSSASNTITFESETGNADDVIVRSTTSSYVAFGTITVENTNAIRIRNLTIVRQNFNASGSNVDLAIRGGVDDLLIEGNKFRSEGGGSNININLLPFDAVQKNITIRGNLLEQAKEGIISDGSNASGQISIEGNRLIGHQTPLNIWAQSAVVRGNFISSAEISAARGNNAIHISALNVIVDSNDIRLGGFRLTGIDLSPPNNTPASAVLTNNMISVSSSAESKVLSVQFFNRAELYHNTFRHEVTTQGGLLTVNLQASYKTIYNNVFMNTTIDGRAISMDASISLLMDYNDYFVPNGNISSINGGLLCRTIEQWRTQSGRDLHSISVEPPFVSATDLHLSVAHPAFALSAPHVAPTDIDGEARTAASVYIGADEYFFAPHSLTAVGGSSYVNLNWVGTNTAFLASSFRIYGARTGSPFQLLGSVPAQSNTFTHTGLTNGSYSYYVAAVSIWNAEGAPSVVASATVSDLVSPAIPQGFSASPGDSQIVLNWNANVESDLAFYKLYFVTGTTNDTFVTIAAPTLNYVHSGLSEGTYFYQLSAVDRNGNESAKTEIIFASPNSLPFPTSESFAMSLSETNGISVFPNPVKNAGQLSVVLASNAKSHVILRSMHNAAVYDRDHQESNVQIPLQGVPKGLYLLEVNQSGKLTSLRIAIE